MPNEIVEKSTDQLLNYGVLGVFCLFLIVLLVILWRYLQKQEDGFLNRTDKFIEVTEKYAKNEAEQTEVLRDLKQFMLTIIKQ